MRLGQLARKLALKPGEIVSFLKSHHITIEENGNTKLEDDHVAMILKKFPPVEVTHAPAPVSETPTKEIAPPAPVAPSVVMPGPEEEKIEVIKAPKVELAGLKVLGKIELPEPKKAEPKTETVPEPGIDENPGQPDVTSEKTETGDLQRETPRRNETGLDSQRETPRRNEREAGAERRRESPRRNERNERQTRTPRKNPIALQREREAMEAERKRQAELEREKEKRHLHYLKKMNTAQPTKAVKAEYLEPEEETVVVARPVPKTWWGRFMRWLNT